MFTCYNSAYAGQGESRGGAGETRHRGRGAEAATVYKEWLASPAPVQQWLLQKQAAQGVTQGPIDGIASASGLSASQAEDCAAFALWSGNIASLANEVLGALPEAQAAGGRRGIWPLRFLRGRVCWSSGF